MKIIKKYLKNNNIINYIPPGIILFFLLFRFDIGDFRQSYEILFFYFTSVLFSFYLFNKKHFYPSFFLLLCIFSSIYPSTTQQSFVSIKLVLIGVLTYYCLSESNIKKEYFYNILCVYCLIHIWFLVAQAMSLDPYIIYGIETIITTKNYTGLTANPNESSALIALCSPVFFRKKFYYLIPFLIVGLYLSKSFGGILSFTIICIAFLTIKTGNILFSIIPILVLIITFSLVQRPDAYERFCVWLAAIKYYFKHNLILGFGIGSWEEISKIHLIEAYPGDYYQRAHNTFLHSWFELGFWFVAICMGYIYKIIKSAHKDKTFILALIAIFISCCVNSAFRINALNGLIILTWMALINKNDPSI